MAHPRDGSRHRPFLGAILLVAAVFLAYLPALDAGFVWDDDDYLTGNAAVQSPGGLKRIWLEPRSSPQYYPLVFSTFWVEHRLWGLNPRGYHATNIALHAGAAVLLWLSLARLLVPGAWVAALLFGLHPVQVESVAWITERKNLLSGVLYLASFLVCLRAFGLDGRRTDPARGARLERGPYALALLLFAGALLSKTVTATLPFAVAIACWRRRLAISTLWLPLLPFLALGAVAGATTAWLEVSHVGASGAAWSLSPLERVLVAGRAVWFYAGKLVWPADLAFNYPRWRVDTGDTLHYLPPLGALALVLLLWRLRERLGRGPLAAALYFLVTLAPALGFVNVYPMRFSFVADHFQYLAAIGPIALLAAGAATATARRVSRSGRHAAFAAGAAGALVLFLLGGLSWRQASWYKDARTLWERTLERNPDAALALWNLGCTLANEQRPEEALQRFRALQRLTPDDPEVPNAIGSVLLAMQRYREAVEHFKRGAALKSEDVAAMNALGYAYHSLGEFDAAERWYRRALEHRSATAAQHAYSCEGLGILAARAGNDPEALRLFEEGLLAAPGSASLHYNVARLAERLGQTSRAKSGYLAALGIDPGHLMAQVMLADLRERSGDAAGARAAFGEIERRHPARAEAFYARGRILEIDGEPARAKEWFHRALEAPTDTPELRGAAERGLRR